MKTTDPLAGIMAFLAVAERASFTAAAEDLEMGRSAVGAQIRALEARLGVQLLQRSTRAVRLTEAGTAYRDALADIQDRVRDAGERQRPSKPKRSAVCGSPRLRTLDLITSPP